MLEAEPEIGRHQTGRSSGVVHAGIYYAPGSLKARLCVEGARDLYAYCEEKGVRFERSGKLIVATAEEELPRLDELERRGTENRVEGLRRLGGDQIAEIEPHARGIAALHSPATGVVDFVAVARAYAADVAAAGGSVHLGAAVRAAVPSRGRDHRSSTPAARPRRVRRSSARGCGRIASRSPAGRRRTRGSSPSAAPTCGSRARPTGWCGPTSTRCRIPISPSSAPT